MSRSSRFFVATMLSSRSADRGGARNQRRSFSDGSHDGRRGQFVTGDSHLRSVRDYNLVHRQGSFSEQPLQQPPPPPLNPRYRCPPPPFYQNQQSRYPPPPFYKNQHSRYPPPPFYQNQHSRYPRPSFNQNQALGTRRPKPLDYRTWEYAKVPPPPNSERFVILSYNLLADYLAIGHRGKLYYHIPRQILDWEWRKRSIIFELGLWSADIMCFQEVDKFQDLESELRLRGYSGIWKMRTGNAIDGCAIFWRTSRFKLLYEESIEYSKLGLRDNVAQICVLEMLGQNFNKNGPPLSTSSAGSSKVVVCNIHVLYNPKRGEIKLGQVRTLLDRAHAVSKIWSDAPVLLCGDFNFTPKSPLYNFISEQKLDLSGVDRDKVSGQASAQIHSWKPHNPNPSMCRVQLADGSTEAPPVVGEGEVDIKLSDPLTVMQKNSKYGNAEIIPFMDNSSPSQSTDALSNLSDKACSHWQSMNKESTLSDVAAIETEQTVVDGFNESSSCLHSEVSVELENLSVRNLDEVANKLENLSVRTPDEAADKLENLSVRTPDEAADKLENLSMKNLDEAEVESGTEDEDDNIFLSELHNNVDAFTSTSDQFVGSTLGASSKELGDEVHNMSPPTLGSEVVNVENITYDPSLWTPMEIATATGNEDCTFLEHPLQLKSTYTEVEDCTGTRDSKGEPLVTSYNRCFMGTVDYIWHSNGIQTVKVLAPIPKHAMQWTPGFPTKKWGSDHIALASEVAIVKD
ncbi:carbon catabolite repressor protein 4 homolog 6 isoform X5 [Mangifera indica]|uniref:carbon catabolite repressor protein 4 homolog 6 isoform X5 n=1 Tax=Mangifera indica TaxID=29780 RepID=UPI001CFBE71C|nr:carbon catabolite repressor protein 4 homolog 6 isoform X5 [Mangifera indica]